MQEITFNIAEGFEWAAKPSPAKEFLPEWWKAMKPMAAGQDEQEIPAGTVKICSPFEDALNAGYMIPLPFQMYVECDAKGEATMRWNMPPGMEWALIGTHSRAQQFPDTKMGLDDGGIFKFQLPYSISLPEGYAALYTHPLNRADLPFQSFSGIVDAGYDSPVNIPFLWISPDSRSFVDAGTPVAQVIPIKLEDWSHSHEIKEMSELMAASRVATTFVHGYRRKLRKPKTWN